MKEAETKNWLDSILEAWEDFKRLETKADPERIVQKICKLYTKRDLGRALLILKPLEKPKRNLKR